MCLIQMGTVPQEACMETIRQWGENVIPHFRKQGADRRLRYRPGLTLVIVLTAAGPGTGCADV